MFILGIFLSYLLGAIPFAYILTRALKGVDIRHYGSGNVGATNVLRVVSPWAAVLVLVLDMFKGLIPVTIFSDFILQQLPKSDPILLRLLLGSAAVCGHNWTIFLHFKGGKGVATSAGALLGLSLKIPSFGLIAALCLGVWVLVVLVTGYISLGSLTAAVCLPIFLLVFEQPVKLLVFALVLCLIVTYRHKSNICKLLRGEEGRIFRAKKS